MSSATSKRKKRKLGQVLAILVSDIHLSHKPPVARSTEPDWYDAMLRPLKQLSNLQDEHECTILCAGDVFDRYDPPPELLLFAYFYLPYMDAVPGQHDLPNHRIKDIKKSAFYLLTRIGTLNEVMAHQLDNPIKLTGFCWGVTPQQSAKMLKSKRHPQRKNIALVHKYLWHKNAKHDGQAKNHPGNAKKEFDAWGKTYDLVVSGDNHKPFIFHDSKQMPRIVNCGSLMRRTIAQDNYQPHFHLYHSCGSVTRVPVDVSQDAPMLPAKQVQEIEASQMKRLTAAIGDLKSLAISDSIEFENVVDEIVGEMNPGKLVRDAIRGIIAGARHG